mgnify:CR=1 FL=1
MAHELTQMQSATLIANPPRDADMQTEIEIGTGFLQPGSEAMRHTADDALTEDWLGRADRARDYYASVRDSYEPGKPLWLTEAAGLGIDPCTLR